MAAKATPVVAPKLTEVSVTHSFGMKVQVVKYEEWADLFASETRRFDVTGMSPEAVDLMVEETRQQMRDRINPQVVEASIEATGMEPAGKY